MLCIALKEKNTLIVQKNILQNAKSFTNAKE